MKKKLAILVIPVLALILLLVWYFLPRPLLGQAGGQIFAVEQWRGDFVDVTDKVDTRQLMDIVACCRRRVSGIGQVIIPDKYPISIGIYDPERDTTLYVAAGPEGALAYDMGGALNWKIMDGEDLWQEITSMLPMDK